MTDSEILDEVYRRLKGDDPHGYKTNPLKDGVRSFIEREWQRRDSKDFTPNPNEPRPTEAQLCSQALEKARPWGLEAELMWSAMNIAAESNARGITFEQALAEAMGEWDL